MIEIYINEMIKNYFRGNKDDNLIIIPKLSDKHRLGEAIITENTITFCDYQYSRNDNESPWEVSKIKSDYQKFKRQCEIAYTVEVQPLKKNIQ